MSSISTTTQTVNNRMLAVFTFGTTLGFVYMLGAVAMINGKFVFELLFAFGVGSQGLLIFYFHVFRKEQFKIAAQDTCSSKRKRTSIMLPSSGDNIRRRGEKRAQHRARQEDLVNTSSFGTSASTSTVWSSEEQDNDNIEHGAFNRAVRATMWSQSSSEDQAGGSAGGASRVPERNRADVAETSSNVIDAAVDFVGTMIPDALLDSSIDTYAKLIEHSEVEGSDGSAGDNTGQQKEKATQRRLLAGR